MELLACDRIVCYDGMPDVTVRTARQQTADGSDGSDGIDLLARLLQPTGLIDVKLIMTKDECHPQ